MWGCVSTYHKRHVVCLGELANSSHDTDYRLACCRMGSGVSTHVWDFLFASCRATHTKNVVFERGDVERLVEVFDDHEVERALARRRAAEGEQQFVHDVVHLGQRQALPHEDVFREPVVQRRGDERHVVDDVPDPVGVVEKRRQVGDPVLAAPLDLPDVVLHCKLWGKGGRRGVSRCTGERFAAWRNGAVRTFDANWGVWLLRLNSTTEKHLSILLSARSRSCWSIGGSSRWLCRAGARGHLR